jgi:hypothetical protein
MENVEADSEERNVKKLLEKHVEDVAELRKATKVTTTDSDDRFRKQEKSKAKQKIEKKEKKKKKKRMKNASLLFV